MCKSTDSAICQVKKYIYEEEIKKQCKIKKRLKRRGYDNYDITSIIPVKIVKNIIGVL